MTRYYLALLVTAFTSTACAPPPIQATAAKGNIRQELWVEPSSSRDLFYGVGGRDLSARVGGLMFREGMRHLAEDDETDTLLLVSKPPAQEVVDLLGEVDVAGKRVVAAFVGGGDIDAPFELHRTLAREYS